MSYTGVALRNTVNTRELVTTPKRCELVIGLVPVSPSETAAYRCGGSEGFSPIFPSSKRRRII